MNLIDKYNDIFLKLFEINESDLNENFTFQNIDEWDSLAHIQLITELEDTFGILFETDDILNFGSFLNGMEILKKYGIQL